jgi:hypothetical protein
VTTTLHTLRDQDDPRTSGPWDPTTEPWTSTACRSGGHDRCPHGLLWYPEGVQGDPVDIPCTCAEPGCACVANAGAGGTK